jgi:ribosomal protein S18 acetylase RimI-like enzyme
MAGKVTIRMAAWEDYPAICYLGIGAASEQMRQVGAHYGRIDPPVAFASVLTCMRNAPTWVAVAEDGRLVGALVFDLRSWPWNATQGFLESQHYYVLPEYRSGGAGLQMVSEAKKFAEAGGVALRIPTSGENPEMLDKVLKAQGFQYTGGNFMYQPPPRKEAAA